MLCFYTHTHTYIRIYTSPVYAFLHIHTYIYILTSRLSIPRIVVRGKYHNFRIVFIYIYIYCVCSAYLFINLLLLLLL